MIIGLNPGQGTYHNKHLQISWGLGQSTYRGCWFDPYSVTAGCYQCLSFSLSSEKSINTNKHNPHVWIKTNLGLIFIGDSLSNCVNLPQNCSYQEMSWKYLFHKSHPTKVKDWLWGHSYVCPSGKSLQTQAEYVSRASKKTLRHKSWGLCRIVYWELRKLLSQGSKSQEVQPTLRCVPNLSPSQPWNKLPTCLKKTSFANQKFLSAMKAEKGEHKGGKSCLYPSEHCLGKTKLWPKDETGSRNISIWEMKYCLIHGEF